MIRRCITLFALSISLATIGTFQVSTPSRLQAFGQQAVFRAGTSVVTVDVSVRRRNAVVTGLTARDFELTDNGIRQNVELIGIDEVPLDVTLVLDQSHAGVENISDRIPAMLQAVASGLSAHDRLAVVLTATNVVEVLPLTAPTEWPGGVPPVPLKSTPTGTALGRGSQASSDAFYDPTTRSSFMDGLLFALTRPELLDRRQLVVGIGYLTAGAHDVSILFHSDALAAVAARSPALFDAALYRTRNMTIRPTIGMSAYRHQVVQQAAEATGGRVREVDDAVDAVKEILRDYRQRYLLRYTATGVPAGGWHTISVKTPAFSEYRIEARRGYVGR